MGVMRATDQVTIVEGGIRDTTELEAKVEELNNNLTASDRTPFRFGVNENGEYGYIITDSEGADSVVPFKSDPKIETISGLTFRRQEEDTSLPVSVDDRVTPHSVISSASKRFKIDISSTGLTEIYGASIYQDTGWQTMHFWGTYIDNNTVYVDFDGVCTNYGTITATLTLIGK